MIDHGNILTDPDTGKFIAPIRDDQGEIYDYETLPESTVKDTVAHTPKMLTWPDEPGVKAGDVYIISKTKHQWRQRNPDTGQIETFRAESPNVMIKLTAHPVRHRKGHWQAPYVWCGLDRQEYMARGAGTTSDRRRAIDQEIEVDYRQPTIAELERSHQLTVDRRTELDRAAAEARRIRNEARFTRLDRAA